MTAYAVIYVLRHMTLGGEFGVILTSDWQLSEISDSWLWLQKSFIRQHLADREARFKRMKLLQITQTSNPNPFLENAFQLMSEGALVYLTKTRLISFVGSILFVIGVEFAYKAPQQVGIVIIFANGTLSSKLSEVEVRLFITTTSRG